MVKKTLEIRGIHRQRLIVYIQEIKHAMVEQQIYDHWDCDLSEEEYLFLFQSDIPRVYITFEAASADLLAKILKEFRLKTLRAGA